MPIFLDFKGFFEVRLISYRGMYTVKLADRVLDFERINSVCKEIPSGLNGWKERIEHFDLTQLRCFGSLRNTKRLECSLGTLGGGNHFIEIDRASDGIHYLIIHSGSRNLGKQVAEFYQHLAMDLHAGKEDYYIKREQIRKQACRNSERPESLRKRVCGEETGCSGGTLLAVRAVP